MAGQIKNTDFLITDPLNQPNVVDRLPDGVEMIDLDDMPYHADPMVRCAFCAQRQRHKDGYFAILSDGQKALCGNCCAANFDEVKKRTIDRSRVRLKKERSARERLLALKNDLDGVYDIASDLNPTLHNLSAAFMILQNVLCQSAIDDMTAVGAINTRILNLPFPYVGSAMESVKKIEGLDALTDRDHEIMAEQKRHALVSVVQAISFIQDAADFFDSSNLAEIEKWAKARGKEFGVRKFDVRQGKLRAHGDGEWRNVPLPQTILSDDAIAFKRPDIIE
tara:strand:- start:3994 stop:4830 length:837 start_codon:yes stop_codon:yes gene_type:complete